MQELLLLVGMFGRYRVTFIFLFFADWNWDPVILDPWNDLPTADIVRWFAQSLPGKHLGPPRSLAQVVAIVFAQMEVTLRQQVHALLVDPPGC